MSKTDRFLISMQRVICILTIIVVFCIAGLEINARAQTRYDLDSNTKLALLAQRTDQIDRHLDYIDKKVDEGETRITTLENDFSQIRGGGILFGILVSLFQVINVILQLRTKRMAGS